MRSGERLLTAAFPNKIVRIFLSENGISILALLRTRAGYVFVNGISLLREEHIIGMDGVRPELVRDCPEKFRENSGKIPGDFVHKNLLTNVNSETAYF